jgi:hypothetical protein
MPEDEHLYVIRDRPDDTRPSREMCRGTEIIALFHHARHYIDHHIGI